MTNFRDLLKQAKAEVGEITPEQIRQRLAAGERFLLLDVREQDEVATGIIPGAAHLSRAHFESRIEDIVEDKDAEVVVYCAGGVRSAFSAKLMKELGYTNVTHMSGGFSRWKD